MKERKLKHSHHAGSKKSCRPHDLIGFCTEKIKINPKDATPYFILAREQNLTGDVKASVMNFERGLKLNPFNIKALNNLAFIYIFLHEYQKGIDLLSKALGIDPDSLMSLLSRGRANALYGRLEESMLDFDHAIDCYPENAEAYMGRKETKILQQDIRGAYEDYTHSVKLDPSMKEKYPWIIPLSWMTGNEVLNSAAYKWFQKRKFKWLLHYWVRFREMFGGSLNGLILLVIIPINEQIMVLVELVEM